MFVVTGPCRVGEVVAAGVAGGAAKHVDVGFVSGRAARPATSALMTKGRWPVAGRWVLDGGMGALVGGALGGLGVEDVLARVVAISDEMEEMAKRRVELGRERQVLVIFLNACGMSGHLIARRCRLTPGRVYQILNTPAPQFKGRGPRGPRSGKSG